jgi:hypothetical protein
VRFDFPYSSFLLDTVNKTTTMVPYHTLEGFKGTIDKPKIPNFLRKALLVILSFYPETDQLKFVVRSDKSKLRETAIATLFAGRMHRTRDDCLTKLVQLNLHYHKIRSILDQCVALCSLYDDATGPPQLLTMDLVKIIYELFAHPQGQSLPRVDTNLFMDKIRSRMEQQLLKGTIDQHMYGVTGTKLDSDDPTPRILHVNYTVKDPTTTGEKRTFSIPHLTDCFSEDFFKELVARINTLPFQNGVGGKQQCYVRFVCYHPDCPMVIGHKHPHKMKFTSTNELVMSVYNVPRMWKDQAITKETKADHKITDQCNMIQYVVGQISKGNYGAHSDACPLLNANGTELRDDISIGMDAFLLLTINKQTTYTIVLTATYRIIISGRTVCQSTHPSFESKLLASVGDNVNILDRSTWHNNYVVTNVIDKIMSPTVIPAVVANPNAAEEEGADGTTEPTPKHQKAANSIIRSPS